MYQLIYLQSPTQKDMSLSRPSHVRPAAGAAADLSTGDGSCEPACVADRGCFEVRKAERPTFRCFSTQDLKISTAQAFVAMVCAFAKRHTPGRHVSRNSRWPRWMVDA